ncbi:hypothetical protein AVEN_175613-1, partial [Araneus ventricosus]
GQQQCSVNEVYKYCGGCDQYCNKPPVSCTADCRPGCYCRVGFKRSFLGGICIPNSICPAPQDSDSSLDENAGKGFGPVTGKIPMIKILFTHVYHLKHPYFRRFC